LVHELFEDVGGDVVEVFGPVNATERRHRSRPLPIVVMSAPRSSVVVLSGAP
jgi:hypothetical protein